MTTNFCSDSKAYSRQNYAELFPPRVSQIGPPARSSSGYDSATRHFPGLGIVVEDMMVRNLAPTTQATYVHQVSMFARYFDRSPEILGPEQIRSYQVYLATEKKLAPSSISTAVAALRFLYNETLKKHWPLEEVIPMPKIPSTLPVVLSPEEVLQFLESVEHIKHRTILTTCYATGLRISEAVHLKPCDIDSPRMVIRVEQGKGQKDRLWAAAHNLSYAPRMVMCREPGLAPNRCCVFGPRP